VRLGVAVQGHRTVQPPLVGERPAYDGLHVVVRQRLQPEQQAAREERADDREERVLGRGRDEEIVPRSTPGSSASCCVLENRCTSSMKSTVCRPYMVSCWRASSMAARTSFTPAVTADSSTNRRPVAVATSIASVVLPVPGGPHSSSDSEPCPSISRRSGVPGSEQVLLTDDLVDRARPHAYGERRRPLLRDPPALVEQRRLVHDRDPTRAGVRRGAW
jgi:hypothetical protein